MIQSNVSLCVNNLKKSYKNHQVLKGLDFKVQKGSIFALLGSNGAGKTTTIKILTTLIKADEGNAQICGYDVNKQGENVREVISLTGQYAAVDDILTGRENLKMIGKLRHLNEINSKIDELLLQFNLVEASDKPVSSYSGGMRRRLDLAMSLIGNPSIIFLDEPTTGLDPQSRISVWKKVKSLADTGVTVFLTTQYLEEAEYLADQIAILHEGKIIVQGTASELKNLLPNGHIELNFNDENEVKKAMITLNEYELKLNKESMTIEVITDGSIKQNTDLLSLLQASNISITEFSLKSPTLEDVFLTIINKNQLEDK
jgi:ABC-2 type transport system ATP-binding protein